MKNVEKIILGAGCFWGVEHAIKKLPGIISANVGYSGGHKENPSYEEVCSGKTGHAEVVLVEYDSEKVDLHKLLEAFWQVHDPTTLNRQGVDIGTQYRSAIYFYTEKQHLAIQSSVELVQKKISNKIVTEILPATTFWKAEEYHQCYFDKNNI